VYNAVYDSLFLEGLCYKNIDSLDLALSRFKECEKIDDTNPALYYEMSKIYESKEELTALFCLDKAYQLDPINYYYAISLAEFYDKNGKYDSSIEIYKDLSKQYPENKNVLFFLYRAYLLDNQIDKSIQTLEKLEDMVGTNKLISFEKVRLYASQKKYKKAINTLNDLIEKYPIDTELYVIKGEMIMEQEGDVEEMLENFNKALAIDPNSPAVQEALCRYYSSIYDKERTEYYLFKILANENISESDKYKYIEYALNNSQFSANQAEYIENIFQTVIKANPESTKILLTYARTLNGLKDYEKMYDVLYSSVLIDERCKECWHDLIKCCFMLPPEILSTSKIREIVNQALIEFPEDSYLNFVDAILMVAEDANVDENILLQKFKNKIINLIFSGLLISAGVLMIVF
jgi:tetratricopeptide (TPR) repeat protein